MDIQKISPKENRAFIKKAMDTAIVAHADTNHLYDGKPYCIHLQMVYSYGLKFSFLFQYEPYRSSVLAACWTHDMIEDARWTYNDVRAAFGEEVAEITYACSNEKGKTRDERANDKYYAEIFNNDLAIFVKMCDRLANLSYGIQFGSGMLVKYLKEHEHFKGMLYKYIFQPMWDEMDRLIEIAKS